MFPKWIGAVFVIAMIACGVIALYAIHSSNDQMLETSVIAMFVFAFIGALPFVAKWRTSRAKVHVQEEDVGPPAVELVPTVDILAGLGAAKPDGQVLIGFAAETDDLIGNAAEKLARKNLDAIVANDVSKPGVGFEHATNEVVILLADGSRFDVPLTDKRDVARRVLDTAAGRLGQQ